MTKIKFSMLAVLLFLLSACASTSPGTKRTMASSCEYGQPNNCRAGEFCVNINRGVAECRPIETANQLSLKFPFLPGQRAICDQGVLTPPGNSHTWWNTAFALDLQSMNEQQNAPIVAGVSGRVIVYGDCRTKNDQCGAGFGNAVKILTADGYLVHYSHLKTVLVQSDQTVNAGDVIGIEGETGSTGADNRHLHLSVHYDWRRQPFEYWKQDGYLPPSVPFKLLLCQNKCGTDCKISAVPVSDIKCRRTSEDAAPLCSR